MKNILLVVDEKKMGGVSILIEDLINNMNLKGKSIDILVLHNNGDRFNNIKDKVNLIYGTKYFEAVDIPIKEIIKSKNIGLLFKKIRLVFDMKTGFIKSKIVKERKKILTKKYDTEIAFKDGFTALFVGYGDCSNKIHWLHYSYKNFNWNAKYDRLFKDALPRFNKIVAVSKEVMNDFNNIYHLEDRSCVINNYVDIKKIIPFKKARKDSKVLKLVSVGRLHEHKGYDRLIMALARLNEEHLLDNVECHIYGDGPMMDNLKNLITLNKLHDIIYLDGSTDNPYSKISASDLFILSSLYESFGIVLVESLTLGIPAIATRNCATDEIIKSGYNGLVVDNSTDGLYNGIKSILEKPEVLTKWKNNLKDYNYDNHNQEILKQLDDIIK